MNSPGESHRKGIALMELARVFPTEQVATEWFESNRWPSGRVCPKCESGRTYEASHKTMPYWYTACRSYFSVCTGTLLERSHAPLLKWVYAFYLETTSLRGVSSMTLHRDIGVSQKTAWFMLNRIHKAYDRDEPLFTGTVEVDETT
ncbi:MAG: IS1595 family transposase [Acidimicrobiaceae bacterium]|nr:IS1595 family transposase [Acidimicrobiaceae bacterium]